MKKAIYLFLLSLAMISCSSGDETKISNSDLVGNWNWTNTEGGIGHHIQQTPESTGNIIQLNLNENYEYSITENGIEILNGIYELTMEKSIYTGEMERFITIEQPYLGLVKNGIINIQENEKLNISDNSPDGIGSDYNRVE